MEKISSFLRSGAMKLSDTFSCAIIIMATVSDMLKFTLDDMHKNREHLAASKHA